MTLTDRIIDALASEHARLTAVVAPLDDAALRRPSGAADWRICDVLSHLGSGAEITLGAVNAVLGTTGTVVDNQTVWDRWNAASPREQADGYVEHNGALVTTLQGLDREQRETLRVDLGFLPEPAPLVVATGLRLNEVGLHGWDVDAGLDPDAKLDADVADLLLELSAGPIGFLLGFIAHPEAVTEPTVVDIAGYGLVIGDRVSMDSERPAAPTATFSGAPEAAVRLVGGRLTPDHTPSDVVVEGNVTLDELRAVFPGY